MRPENIGKINNKNKKITKIILYAIIIIIIYNILVVGVSSILNRNGKSLLGFKAYIITTESMNPNINSGDIVIVKETKEDLLEVGDVITFKINNGAIITHRIIDIIQTPESEKEYVTKGDNNNLEDIEKVKYEQIEGSKVLKVPYLGNIAILLQDEVYLILIIIIILLICLHLQRLKEKTIIRREKKKEEDEKFKNKNDLE